MKWPIILLLNRLDYIRIGHVCHVDYMLSSESSKLTNYLFNFAIFGTTMPCLIYDLDKTLISNRRRIGETHYLSVNVS